AKPLDIFALMEKIEWDTLLFFYGVLLGVGGLGALGYLAFASEVLYVQLGATPANVIVGLLSAVVDNVPVMFAVLQIDPHMSDGEWLLATLTTGVGARSWKLMEDPNSLRGRLLALLVAMLLALCWSWWWCLGPSLT